VNRVFRVRKNDTEKNRGIDLSCC